MNNESRTVELSLTLAEVNQILDALGTQPYVRVFQLIGKIQQQAEGQLSGRSHASSGAQNGAPAPAHARAAGE